MNLKKYAKLAGLVLAIVTTFIVVQAQTEHGAMEHMHDDSSHRMQDNTDKSDFAEREREVMPFDLDATLHIFEDTALGGVQRVVSNHSNDTKNIALIRSHLKKEAAQFAEGVFTDPSYLHGEEMPGLSKLQTAGKTGQLTVNYSDTENGGQIVYTSEEAEVVIALHLWFQAQVTDHGDHATN